MHQKLRIERLQMIRLQAWEKNLRKMNLKFFFSFSSFIRKRERNFNLELLKITSLIEPFISVKSCICHFYFINLFTITKYFRSNFKIINIYIDTKSKKANKVNLKLITNIVDVNAINKIDEATNCRQFKIT